MTHSNFRGNCWLIPKKSIVMLAKKLPTSVSYGNQVLNFNPMIFQLEHLSLVQNNKTHSFPKQEINALYQSCIIYLCFYFLAYLNSPDKTPVELTCCLFLLIKNSLKAYTKIRRVTDIISHSSSKRTSIFNDSQSLKLSNINCFTTCMDVHYPTVELDNAIQFTPRSGLL